MLDGMVFFRYTARFVLGLCFPELNPGPLDSNEEFLLDNKANPPIGSVYVSFKFVVYLFETAVPLVALFLVTVLLLLSL